MTHWARMGLLGLLVTGCGGLKVDTTDTGTPAPDTDEDTDETDDTDSPDTDTDPPTTEQSEYETCETADAAGALGTGIWDIGFTEQGSADYESTCYGSAGPEHVVKVSVQEGEQLSVWFESVGDGVIYLVEDCANLNTCIAGADAMLAGAEELKWYHPDNGDGVPDPFHGYLFLDTYWPTDSLGPYTATIEIGARLEGFTAYDTCAEAETGELSWPGVYTVDMTPFSNSINLGSSGSCTGFSTNGNEGILRIQLGNGETLLASWDSNSDSAVYILSDCNDVSSCLDGDDSGDPEVVAYTNTTGASQIVYLVIDSWSSFSTSGELEIDIY